MIVRLFYWDLDSITHWRLHLDDSLQRYTYDLRKPQHSGHVSKDPVLFWQFARYLKISWPNNDVFFREKKALYYSSLRSWWSQWFRSKYFYSEVRTLRFYTFFEHNGAKSIFLRFYYSPFYFTPFLSSFPFFSEYSLMKL